MVQIIDAYKFINTVFDDNYDEIKKINAPFLEKDDLKPTNTNKKRTIKIKIANIKNYPNITFINTVLQDTPEESSGTNI